MNARMRDMATLPSGSISGPPATTPMSAIFIGAVAVSAQSAHKSGTGTRTIGAAAVLAKPESVEARLSKKAFILRMSLSNV